MKGQIIKQPNGKYCIFSNNVDNITFYDLTPEEIISDSDTPERAQRTIDKLEEGVKPYFQFTLTFDEMLDRIKQVHGKDEASKVWRLIFPKTLTVYGQWRTGWSSGNIYKKGDIFKKHSDKLNLLWTTEQWDTVMAAMAEFAEQEVKNYPAITVAEIFGLFHKDEDENLSLIDLYLSEEAVEERKAQLESYPSFGKWFGPEQVVYRDRRLGAIADIEHRTGMVWLLDTDVIRKLAETDATLAFVVSEVDKMRTLMEYPYPDFCRTGDGTFEVHKHEVK